MYKFSKTKEEIEDEVKELELLKKESREKGFNIYMFINKFKKEQKKMGSTVEIPNDVYIELCKRVLTYVGKIKQPWPYFMTTLVSESGKWNAQRNMWDHKKVKKQGLGTSPIKIHISMG